MKRKILAAVLAVGIIGSLTACTMDESTRDTQRKESVEKFDGRTAPDVSGDAEYENYIAAQELYDDPASIIWCTVFPPSDAAPIFTVAVKGKLTSSSVSFYPGQSPKHYSDGSTVLLENQSVDGMFHGSPPPYRFGFTPGGQYVDFFNLPTFCTTALNDFQRASLSVSIDTDADAVTKQAEEKLAAGDPAAAQGLIDGLGK